jgi:hypothetical protein
MGTRFMDKYSLLHFAVGIISRYWNITLLGLFIIHILFEFAENTTQGMYFINTWIPIWPGGKTHSDSFVNRIGDTVFAGLGWIAAHYCVV